MSWPTAKAGLTPVVLTSLENQIKAMPAKADSVTYKQDITARVTAAVAAVAAAVDALYNTVSVVVKSVTALADVSVAKWTGLKVPEALGANEWKAHAVKVATCSAMVCVSLFVGLAKPQMVLDVARDIEVMPKPQSKRG